MLIDAAVSQNLEVRLPAQGFHGGAEGAGGGVAGEVGRYHHGNAQRHRRNGQGAAQQIAAERAQDEAEKDVAEVPDEPHRRSMDWTRPSRSSTRVPAMAAASAEGVAIRTVAPKRLAASRMSASPGSPLAASRFPLGSS